MLTKLDLRSNHLIGSIPSSIGNLENLTYLYLQYNKLSGSIPDSIGNLYYLGYLILDNNNLSGSIPISIGELIELKNLSLNNNNLSGPLPESIKNLTSINDLTNNYLVADTSFDFWLDEYHKEGANYFRDNQKFKAEINFRVTEINTNNITLKWSDNSNGKATYEIYKDDTLLTELPAGATKYSVGNLTSGATYNFTLKTKYYNIYTMSTDLNISITAKKRY